MQRTFDESDCLVSNAKMVKVPEFEHTPIDKIPVIYNRLQKSFLQHKTRPLEWRLTQLRKLYWG